MLTVMNGNPSSWAKATCSVDGTEKDYYSDCTKGCVFYSFQDSTGKKIHSTMCSKCTSEWDVDLMLAEFDKGIVECWYRPRILGYSVRFDMEVFKIIQRLKICVIVFSGISLACTCWSIGEFMYNERTRTRARVIQMEDFNHPWSIEMGESNTNTSDKRDNVDAG